MPYLLGFKGSTYRTCARPTARARPRGRRPKRPALAQELGALREDPYPRGDACAGQGTPRGPRRETPSRRKRHRPLPAGSACACSTRAARVRVHLLALLRATALACTTARLQRARRVRSRVGVPEWAVHCLRSRALARLVVASPHALTTRALRALRARTWREYVVRARRLARGIRALDEARELHHKKSLVFLITYWLVSARRGIKRVIRRALGRFL